MLKLLENAKAGIEKPSVISNAAAVKCINNLNVSSCKSVAVEDIFTVSIQHIQGDNCEGKFLLTGRSNGSLLLHNIKNATLSMTYKCECLWKCGKDDTQGHKYSVECVRWFPTDNGIFVTGGFDRRFKIWDTSCLKCVETITFPGRIFNFDLSPGISRNCSAAVCSSKGMVSIIELQSGTNIHTLKEHIGDVLSCKWSPIDEHILATGGADNKVLLWDIRCTKSFLNSFNRCNTIHTTDNRPCSNNFTAHTGSVNALIFVRNGLKLISCGTDNVIRLWDTLTSKNELVDYDSFSNGKRNIQIDTSRGTNPEFLFTPCKESINMYEVETGKLVKSLRGHFSNVNCCYFEPFQHELYSGGSDAMMLIWCDETAKERAYLPGY